MLWKLWLSSRAVKEVNCVLNVLHIVRKNYGFVAVRCISLITDQAFHALFGVVLWAENGRISGRS